MEQLAKVQEPFYILATEGRSDEHTRVLKHGESFAVFDHSGWIGPTSGGELGLYHEDTRFLSRLELLVDGRRPLLLSSAATEDRTLVADLTNPDLSGDRGLLLPRDTVHFCCASLLWEGAFYQQLRVRNFSLAAIDLTLTVLFAADYRDVFEVRGTTRAHRGEMLEPRVGSGTALLAYHGLDGVTRRTRLAFSPAPDELSDSRAEIHLAIAPHGERTLDLVIGFETDGAAPRVLGFDQAVARAHARAEERRAAQARVHSSNELFNEWLYRSANDLELMVTDTPHGPYPYAGIPWYSTAFGRDGIITALETLWLDPELASGVLRFLAATQASEIDPERDAEPGKIVHEMRRGEMAALGEVPFGRYYGSVDATPLFVVLAGAYYERTADRELIAGIWENVERALAWMDLYGDADGDGFLEYRRRSSRGLLSQGWRDSVDAVFHADGRLAEGPIALCEVQGYAYAAWQAGAALAAVLGHGERAQELAGRAARLAARFEEAFWCEEIGTYALALDGTKRQCSVRTSNAGHCLFAGIAGAERARRVAETLSGEGFFTGWGIRTVDCVEVRYNPMSYHNGSVWPHDNALIAAGLARYGMRRQAARVLDAMFDASVFVDLHRLPELFCGFHRRRHEGPTLYPVACSPQSWAAGAVFLLIQACLGLSVDAPRAQIRLARPELPASLRSLRIAGLRVGEASVDLYLERRAGDVGVTLDSREGEVEILVAK